MEALISNTSTYSKIELQSVSMLATQMREDILAMYPRTNLTIGNPAFIPVNLEVKSLLETIPASGVVLIAARQDNLRKQFRYAVAQHLGLEGKGVLAFFGFSISSVNFVQEFANKLAHLSSDTVLYDGQSSTEDIFRLSEVLSELGTSKIYIKSGKHVELDGLYKLVCKQKQIDHHLGLIVIDNAQLLYRHEKMTGSEAAMRQLNEISAELNIPVIALDGLDAGVNMQDYLLTRHELALMEMLSHETREILLMGHENGKLFFQRPKINHYNSRNAS